MSIAIRNHTATFFGHVRDYSQDIGNVAYFSDRLSTVLSNLKLSGLAINVNLLNSVSYLGILDLCQFASNASNYFKNADKKQRDIQKTACLVVDFLASIMFFKSIGSFTAIGTLGCRIGSAAYGVLPPNVLSFAEKLAANRVVNMAVNAVATVTFVAMIRTCLVVANGIGFLKSIRDLRKDDTHSTENKLKVVRYSVELLLIGAQVLSASALIIAPIALAALGLHFMISTYHAKAQAPTPVELEIANIPQQIVRAIDQDLEKTEVLERTTLIEPFGPPPRLDSLPSTTNSTPMKPHNEFSPAVSPILAKSPYDVSTRRNIFADRETQPS